MRIELKIESWGKQNCDFDLEAIIGEVAISTSISEIRPALLTARWTTRKPSGILSRL